MEKTIAIQFMNRLESFLLEKNIEVQYGVDFVNAYYPESRIIEINTRQDFESRLYSLLHEAGHVQIRDDDFQNSFPFLRKRISKSNGGEYRYNNAHRVDLIREEVLAWDAGEKIAHNLGIAVDPVRWSKQRTKYILSYMKWTNN